MHACIVGVWSRVYYIVAGPATIYNVSVTVTWLIYCLLVILHGLCCTHNNYNIIATYTLEEA